MSLPLTSIIDPENYIETSIKLMHEFLLEFFNAVTSFDLDLRFVIQEIPNPLKKPIMTIILNPENSKLKGPINQEIADTILGKYKDLSWDIYLITDDATGGWLVLDRYCGYLESIFDRYAHYLGEKKIKESKLYGPTLINSESFYQKTFILTNQLTLCWRP